MFDIQCNHRTRVATKAVLIGIIVVLQCTRPPSLQVVTAFSSVSVLTSKRHHPTVLTIAGAQSQISSPTLQTRRFGEHSVSKLPDHHGGSSTSLQALMDVPDHFFATTFAMSYIILSISKDFARHRMEERAWDQRLEEARQRRMEEDPTISELDLRKQEAALEWSAYGEPRMDEERMKKKQRQVTNERRQPQRNEERAMSNRMDAGDSYSDDNHDEFEVDRGRRRRNRVRVLERDEVDYDDDEEFAHEQTKRPYHMSDDEINRFEVEYNLEYDPYYDDPYSEDELPDDIEYRVDRKYGDRIYENGEVFFKDKTSGLYFRQGAKPRDFSFW